MQVSSQLEVPGSISHILSHNTGKTKQHIYTVLIMKWKSGVTARHRGFVARYTSQWKCRRRTPVFESKRPRQHIAENRQRAAWKQRHLLLTIVRVTGQRGLWLNEPWSLTIRARLSAEKVGRGKCRSMKMRVLETEWTRSPHLKLAIDVQTRGGLWDPTILFKDFVALCGLKTMVKFINHNLNQRVGSWDKSVGGEYSWDIRLLERIFASFFPPFI